MFYTDKTIRRVQTSKYCRICATSLKGRSAQTCYDGKNNFTVYFCNKCVKMLGDNGVAHLEEAIEKFGNDEEEEEEEEEEDDI